MCGFLFYFSTKTPCDREKFSIALNSIKHRGPDFSGTWTSDDLKISVGHNRLTINGGDSGNQPMHSVDRKTVAAVNGEIYNDSSELSRYNARCITGSDSEFLLHQFEHSGLDGLDRLDGEFSFALYNAEEHVAYLGRDRHGIKPLFYYRDEGGVIAASEIKALLAYGVPARWNKKYLAGSEYFVQDARETFVEGVYALPPGYVLKVSNNGVELIEYVKNSPFYPSRYSTSDLSYSEACAKFDQLLIRAVEKRFNHERSNQVYLSSGIDSSLIAAISRHLSSSVNAYSIGFGDSQLDESCAAAVFAKEMGINHEVVNVSDLILADSFSSAVLHSEMPIPNINVAAKYYLSKVLSNAGHKTVLTGEGADESLLGYGFLRQDVMSPYNGISQFPASWLPHLTDVQSKFGFLPAQLVNSTGVGLLLTQLRNSSFEDEEAFSTFESSDWPSKIAGIHASQTLHYQSVFQSYNLGALADRTEMANGIEGRPPFLDNSFVNFVHSLPQEYKFDGEVDKKILREVATRYMPKPFCYIEKKPFISEPASLRSSGILADLFQDIFSDLSVIPDFYNGAKVRDFYNQARLFGVQEKAKLDPVFMNLASLIVLQKEYRLSL